MLVGVFVCSVCVKGSSQPQARVYLTFDGKQVDKFSGKMLFIICFLIQIKKLKAKSIVECWFKKYLRDWFLDDMAV